MAQAGAQALIVARQPQNLENLQLIFELAEAGRLPAIFPYPEAGKLGGLLSYGPDVVEGVRHWANQIASVAPGQTSSIADWRGSSQWIAAARDFGPEELRVSITSPLMLQ